MPSFLLLLLPTPRLSASWRLQTPSSPDYSAMTSSASGSWEPSRGNSFSFLSLLYLSWQKTTLSFPGSCVSLFFPSCPHWSTEVCLSDPSLEEYSSAWSSVFCHHWVLRKRRILVCFLLLSLNGTGWVTYKEERLSQFVVLKAGNFEIKCRCLTRFFLLMGTTQSPREALTSHGKRHTC